MKSSRLFATVGLLTSFSVYSIANAVAPETTILDAAKAQYPLKSAGDHVKHIPVEVIISDVDFFLRAFGALQGMVDRGDKSEHIAQRHRFALSQLKDVLSNLSRSRLDGALKNKSLFELVAMAIQQRQFIAARYFINECLRAEDANKVPSWLINEVQQFYRRSQANFDALKLDVALFNSKVVAYQKLLAKSKAELIEIEASAAKLFGSAEHLSEIPDETVAALRNLQMKMREVLKNLQAARLSADNRDKLAKRIVSGAHLELCEFIEQVFNEYQLGACEWLEFADVLELLELPPGDENQVAQTLPQWQLLAATVLPILSMTPPGGVNRGVGRGVRIPLPQPPPREQTVARGAPEGNPIARIFGFN